MVNPPNHDASPVRLDQWLFAARFYKNRALAVTAIKNHRVLVNGQRCKPARTVVIGDTLTIEKQHNLVFSVVVEQLASKRPSAKIAQNFYRETQESIDKREALREQQQLARDLISFPSQRPDKHDRRKIRAVRRDFL